MTVIMKSILLLATLLSTSMALEPHKLRQPVADELRGRQEGGVPGGCPGGQDVTYCVPYLNQQCPTLEFAQCSARSDALCACQCDCDKKQCNAVDAPVPSYCQ
ncbi:succinate--CoA ligase beta chain [Hypoxylon texense]